MPARTSSRSVIGLFLVAGLALTGCTGTADEVEAPASSSAPEASPTPSTGDDASSGQTSAEACELLQRGIEDIQTDLSENFSTFASDPDAASVALDELSTTFSANVSEVTNPQIAEVAAPADAALTALTEQFTALAADPANANIEALTSTANDVQTTFTALGEVCG